MSWLLDFFVYLFENYRVEIFQILALLLLFLFRRNIEEFGEKLKGSAKDKAVSIVLWVITLFLAFTLDDPFIPYQLWISISLLIFLLSKPVVRGANYVYKNKIAD